MSTEISSDKVPHTRKKAVPNGVLGMVLFVLSEVMFFLALISSFLIVKSRATVWPPLGQPRLPIEQTAFNTFLLILSGVLLYMGARAFSQEEPKPRCKKLILSSIIFGGAFVILQGYEWVSLLAENLTLTSSTLGSFFYVIIGLHALHAIVAIGMLLFVYKRLMTNTLNNSILWTTEVFWYFVVVIWPILYWQVYLT